MFWRGRKKAIADAAKRVADVAGAAAAIQQEQIEALTRQVEKMAAEWDRQQAELETAKRDLAAARAGETAAAQQVAAMGEAFQNVGEAASYRVRKGPEESWPDYKRRVLDILDSGRETPFCAAIFDWLTFREREAYRRWRQAKTPAEAEALRMAACAAYEMRVELSRAITYKNLVSRREEDLRDEEDFGLAEIDEARLAKTRRAH